MLALLFVLGLTAVVLSIKHFWLYRDAKQLKDDAEEKERDAFVRAHTKDMGEDPAGEFWDLYH